MKYKNLALQIIDTDKEKVICPWCHEVISKEEINADIDSSCKNIEN